MVREQPVFVRCPACDGDGYTEVGDVSVQPAPLDVETIRSLVNGHESYCDFFYGDDCTCGYDAARTLADEWLDGPDLTPEVDDRG